LYPTLYHTDLHDEELQGGVDVMPLSANLLLSKLEKEVHKAVEKQLAADKKQAEIKEKQAKEKEAKAVAAAEAKEAKEQDEDEDKEDPEVDLTGAEDADADVEMAIDEDKAEKQATKRNKKTEDKKKEKKDKDEDKDNDKDDKNDDQDELDAVEVKDRNGRRRTFNAIPVVDAPTFKKKLDEHAMTVRLPLPEVHNISSHLIPSSFPVHSQTIQLIPTEFPEPSQRSIHMY